jgi:hypothetical protein
MLRPGKDHGHCRSHPLILSQVPTVGAWNKIPILRGAHIVIVRAVTGSQQMTDVRAYPDPNQRLTGMH